LTSKGHYLPVFSGKERKEAEMTQWEIQVEKQHHGQPFPKLLFPGEGAFPEQALTPPSSFADLSADLPAAGHREFLRKRRYLAKVLQHLQASGLPGQEQAQNFMVHLYRRNCRPNTLRAYAGAIRLFLTFLRHKGKVHLEALTREDLEAFLEQEQDRGLKATSVKSHLSLVKAWVRFLIDREVVRPEVLSRNIVLKLPELLPRAMDPEDVKQLLAVVTKVRDRALVLLLLRTGMRIGELLSTMINDLNLRERKILIYQAEKTQIGRVVYFSDDAREALGAWLAERDPHKSQLFYGRGRDSLGYTAARVMFLKHLQKAGLAEKGYSLHCLRHTFASELLNAGMRLECLQQLLGHAKLEMTRRYARLTDRTREEEYFRAMARIERGEIHGHYRCDRELPALSQEAQPLAPHG
jgi:integrase/recombinase XerD